MTFEKAVEELYQAPLGDFVAERKRLAGELKAAGHAAEAKQLGEKKKPPISAWVVNQLWWHARDAFDALLVAAAKLRKGQLDAQGAHRDAIAKLRARASAILGDAGHPPTEATLRRVTTTLAAVSATGGFDPDPPGALQEDRDPPGFEAIAGLEASVPVHKPHAAEKKHHADDKKRDRDELEEARERAEKKRAEDQEAKRRAEAERARIRAEKHRLETELRDAKAALREAERKLRDAQHEVGAAHKHVETLEAELQELRDAN